MSSERRRSTRIEILGRLHGRVVSLDMPVRVREISLGGMAIETAVSFPEGAVHDFRLTLGDGAHIVLRGQARHCRNLAAEGQSPLFVTGFEFIDDDLGDSQSTVGDLIDKL
jgi:PilZ domain